MRRRKPGESVEIPAAIYIGEDVKEKHRKIYYPDVFYHASHYNIFGGNFREGLFDLEHPRQNALEEPVRSWTESVFQTLRRNEQKLPEFLEGVSRLPTVQKLFNKYRKGLRETHVLLSKFEGRRKAGGRNPQNAFPTPGRNTGSHEGGR